MGAFSPNRGEGQKETGQARDMVFEIGLDGVSTHLGSADGELIWDEVKLVLTSFR